MRFWQSLASAVGLSASTGVAEPRNVMSERLWGIAGQVSLAGQVVTRETGLQLPVVEAVLHRLGSTVSTLPWMVFERISEDETRPAREHPLFNVLHRRPNSRQTSAEFRELMIRDLAWERNFLARIVPGEHPIGALDYIAWPRVLRVERSSDGWVYYTVQRLAPQTGQDVLREDEVFHIRKAPLTADGLRGRPVYETASELLGYAQAVEAFGKLYFANGGSGGGVLEHPGKFSSPAERDDFMEAWRAGGNGLNRHKDRLLLYGVKYNPFSVNNDEAQFNETRREVSYALASQWGMQGHMVNLLDRATNNNIEQQSLEYVIYTVAPPVIAIEQAAERDLLIGQDQDRYFVSMNMAGLLRGDIKSRFMAYAVGRQWGWLSANDVLRLENRNGIGPQGDVYLSPSNMMPAGAAADPAANVLSPKDPANA
ncbi:MAG: phage portal protein [Caulobacter sp.]|nr:phage portal protein [Caulobacter sp.]